MKILTCAQQKEADAYTIANEPISSIELMERAAAAMTRIICSRWDTSHRMIAIAGAGNNGGDALAIARLLADKGYSVNVIFFNVTGKISEECLANVRRLDETAIESYTEVTKELTIPAIKPTDVIIDGLFGSGLDRPLEKGFAKVVQMLNSSPAPIVSIDIPSGMMGENNSTLNRPNIIHATLTLSVQLPKLAFLFAENADLVGEWVLVDIGISKDFLERTSTPYSIAEAEEIRSIIKPRKKFDHKGMFGHGLLIAGSYGMGGAAVLSAQACLRSGIGLLTVHTPVCNHALLQAAVPEAMTEDDVHEHIFASETDLDAYQAVAVGPGLGQDDLTAEALYAQIKNCYMPMIVDADALNLLARNSSNLSNLPADSILTPHPKELERIVGRCSNSYERLTKAKELASYLRCYIVLKGAWTAVISPNGSVSFNPTGNPGMATGGSGDVLTGILLALLSQGYNSSDACRLGVYVHGQAGDIACRRMGEISMTAGDIIAALPEAWKQLSDKNNVNPE